jgi:two-component system sensor histidine kinase VicK
MAETGQPLIIDDVQRDNSWLFLPETHWIRGYLGAPIRVEGEVIGFINLDAEKPGVFCTQHAETLKIFAEQAGVALRNARLYDQLRQQTVDLELRVVERTAEVERERAQLRAILDGMGEGVIGMIFGSKPDEVVYRYTNSALQQLTGHAPEEWDPKTIFIGSLPPEKFVSAWKELIEGVIQNGVWRTETRVQRKDGTEFDASLTVTRIIGKDGQTEGVVSILRDVSQEKALARQKADFVARASHELRTPITNLKTWLYLLRRQPEHLDNHLRVLEEVTERMRKLVEDLLDLTRFERGIIRLNCQPTVLQDLVARLVEIQQPEAASKQIQLICELPHQPLKSVL